MQPENPPPEHVPLFKYKKRSRLLERLRACLLLHAKTFFESVDTSACVYQLLTAGKEGVTFGTDFHADILFRGTCMDHFAAGAGDRGVYILWMDSVFHNCFTSL